MVITAREHRDRIARAVVGQRLRAARTVGQTLSEPLGRSFSLVTGLCSETGGRKRALKSVDGEGRPAKGVWHNGFEEAD
jgi:hypothetical protein